jgi:hypothetical protein
LLYRQFFAKFQETSDPGLYGAEHATQEGPAEHGFALIGLPAACASATWGLMGL